MLKIGITGSIGSGKSTACRIFETIGIPVYYADTRGKYLMQNEDLVKEKILSEFGPEILDKNKSIDRIQLAGIVFNDPEKLEKLESIIHPAVFSDFHQWVQIQNAPYILKEAAVLFESGSYKELDKIITVAAPRETRIARVLTRDNATREQIMAREKRQWPDAMKIEMADYILVNDEKQLLLPQIENLNRLLISILSGKSENQNI